MKLEAVQNTNKHGDSLWRVIDDVRVKIAPRMYVQVPAGYVSNLGTVPRWARWYVSPSEGGFVRCFVVHDYMCDEDADPSDGQHEKSGYSRWIADSVLYELMVRAELPWHKRYIVWLAVRLAARWKGLR